MPHVLRSRPFRKNPRPTRAVRLRLEELEPRTMLSAAPVAVPLAVVQQASHGSSSPVINVTTPPATALTPAQIQQAYGFNLNNLTGAGQTIAIVDAYNDPNIVSDLATFDSYYKLPGTTTSTVNQFLKVINENGKTTSLPATNAGWDTEIALDVEWAHAIAPGANIVLVEASSASNADLFKAVDTASSQKGVSVVSMSWGTSEFFGETRFDSHFSPATHPGITFVAASGDSVVSEYPAASPYVLSVGGTTLFTSNSPSPGTYAGELAWDSSGGLPSPFEAEPSYQLGVQQTGIRVTPDVAYDADPSTGVAVYDSVPYGRVAGWQQFGGTSIGAPQWSALVARVDQGLASQGQGPITGATQLLPALYKLYASNATGNYFHVITTDDSGMVTLTGYNDYTGLGTPVANNLIPALISSFTSAAVNASTKTTAGPLTTVHLNAAVISDPVNVNTIVTTLSPTPNSITTNSNLLVIVLTGNSLPPIVPFFGNLAVTIAYASNASPPPQHQPGIFPRVGLGLGPVGKFGGYRRPVRVWGPSEYAEETPVEDPLPPAEDPQPVPPALQQALPLQEGSSESNLGGPAAELALVDACFIDHRWLTETTAAVTRRMIAENEEDPSEDREKATQAAAALIALALLTSPCGSSLVEPDKRNRWLRDNERFPA